MKECPSCALEYDAEAHPDVCPYCGYEFPEQKSGLKTFALLFALLMLWPVFKVLEYLFG
jgi:hypothetical protein